VATILIISSIVKRSLWRASPLARGGRFYSGGQPPRSAPHWRRRCQDIETHFILYETKWF